MWEGVPDHPSDDLVGKGHSLPTVLAAGQYIQDTANQDFILVILGALEMPSLPTHAPRGSDKRDAMRPHFWCKIRTVRTMTRTAGQQQGLQR